MKAFTLMAYFIITLWVLNLAKLPCLIKGNKVVTLWAIPALTVLCRATVTSFVPTKRPADHLACARAEAHHRPEPVQSWFLVRTLVRSQVASGHPRHAECCSCASCCGFSGGSPNIGSDAGFLSTSCSAVERSSIRPGKSFWHSYRTKSGKPGLIRCGWSRMTSFLTSTTKKRPSGVVTSTRLTTPSQ